MSDINVTPLVDVMLVLLIVFMVAAPLLSAGVPVDLPHAEAAPLPVQSEPITITIAGDGKLFVKDKEVALADLVPRLKATAGGDDRIYVRGDKGATYGAIMQVMGRISAAGFTHLALVALSDTNG
jgi:biopolymer transport protein TolR